MREEKTIERRSSTTSSSIVKKRKYPSGTARHPSSAKITTRMTRPDMNQTVTQSSSIRTYSALSFGLHHHEACACIFSFLEDGRDQHSIQRRCSSRKQEHFCDNGLSYPNPRIKINDFGNLETRHLRFSLISSDRSNGVNSRHRFRREGEKQYRRRSLSVGVRNCRRSSKRQMRFTNGCLPTEN